MWGGGQGAGEVGEAGEKRAGSGSSKMAGCGSEMQNVTPCQITHHQLSAPASKSNTSDFEVAPELKHGNGSDRDIRQPHTGIYAIRSRSNFFSVFISNEREQNDIFGTEYVVMDESSSSFQTSGEGALTTCKKSDIFCEIDKGTVRLFDSRLQLSRNILQDSVELPK